VEARRVEVNDGFLEALHSAIKVPVNDGPLVDLGAALYAERAEPSNAGALPEVASDLKASSVEDPHCLLFEAAPVQGASLFAISGVFVDVPKTPRAEPSARDRVVLVPETLVLGPPGQEPAGSALPCPIQQRLRYPEVPGPEQSNG